MRVDEISIDKYDDEPREVHDISDIVHTLMNSWLSRRRGRLYKSYDRRTIRK